MLKYLADVNIEKTLVDYLKENGNDVIWIPDYDCKLTDDALLSLANSENWVIITNDTDFGEIIFFQKKITTGIILIRVKDQDVNKKLYALKKLLNKYPQKIKNNFIVITEKRIRIRSLVEIW